MAGGRKPSSAEPTPFKIQPDTSSAHPPTGGQFLLQLLQKPPSTPTAASSPSDSTPLNPYPHFQDPAVAAIGPSHTFPPWPTDPRSLLPDPRFRPPSPYPLPPSLYPPIFPQNPWPLPAFSPRSPSNAFDFQNPQFPSNPPFNNFHHFGFPRSGDALIPQHQIQPLPPLQQQRKDGMSPDNSTTLTFGSLKFDLRIHEGLPNGNSTESVGATLQPRHGPVKDTAAAGRVFKGSLIRPHEKGSGVPWTKHHRVGLQRSVVVENRRPPPPPVGQSRRPKGPQQWVFVNENRDGERNLEKEDEMLVRQTLKDHVYRGDVSPMRPLTVQLDNPVPPTGSKLHSVPAADFEESLTSLRGEVVADGRRSGIQRLDRMSNPDGRDVERDMLSELLTASLTVGDEEVNNNAVRQNNGSRGKDLRPDTSRGLQVSGQRMRNRRTEIIRSDIEKFTPYFLSIYKSMIPPEEEKAKQKQLLASLEKLVKKEWPRAQLDMYGSCANSFGVSKSDIDVCMTLNDDNISKPDILLQLAEILESDNLQNVQALTHARVPIVKLMDPVTKISCDICINNVLAVVNTKLLRDYAQIDVRLRELAFIVKHWAKSRGVNETYRGTLSSYAYVLMCIHFLQLRRPAILPCLQEMNATYVFNIDDVECAYFDRVEKLRDFGVQNKESIARLLWTFFDYWAYRHDYANAVISVRTGGIISKRAKDWTRRIGNDRHLICIEDPFEINHDLGRVVDKYSIKILREEFERAADIMQYDPNPNITLFEPYVAS